MDDDRQPSADFVRELRDLFPTPAIPADREQHILEAARTHLTTRTRPPAYRWSRLGAAAALLVMACSVFWWTTPPTVARDGDIDRNGRVDIADAYRLALSLKHGTRPRVGDLTDDGRVDEADVQAIINTAVRLKRGG